MNTTDKKQIEDVTNAIDAIYNRIDACRNSDDGFVARVAEYHNINTHSAMDMIMSEASDAYDFISDELVEEAVELIRALYWAREYANNFPMPAYNTPSDDEKKYLSALGKAITSAPEKARQAKKERDQKEIDRITKEFGEWSDNLNKQMERDFPFLKQD